MNEMNNWESNNQNIGQPNLNENQNMVQPEQQYVQPEQPVNNQESPKKSNALIIILLLLLVIGLAGFIVYDKVIKKDEPPKQEETNNVEEPIKTTEKVEVANAYHSTDEYFTVPKLTGNSENISNINKKIENDVITSVKNAKEEIIDAIDNTETKNKLKQFEIKDLDSAYKLIKFLQEDFPYGGVGTVGYKSYFKNNTIAIWLDDLVFCNASCPTQGGEFWYFFDIENDKEIYYREAAKRFNATIDGKETKDYNISQERCVDIEIDKNNSMNIITEDVFC